MPIYTFHCKTCGFKQEEILDRSKKDTKLPCKKCGELCGRQVLEEFSTPSNVHGSPMTSKEIDLVVGKDAHEKWMGIEKDRNARRQRQQKVGVRDMGVVVDSGKFNPHDILGDDRRKQAGAAWTKASKEAIKTGVDFDGTSLKTS